MTNLTLDLSGSHSFESEGYKGTSQRIKLVVIIPAYNEAEMITKSLAVLRQALDSLPQVDGKLCVIDDGSCDGTGSLAQLAGADAVIIHKQNRGLGAAVRSGLAASRNMGADVVVKFDADMQHDPADLIPLITPILADEADIVYGNRFEKIDYSMPIIRRAGNFAFTGLMRWLTGWPLRDSQPGMFAVNRSYLECFFIPGDYNYTQQILLDAFHKGMRFAHVSISFRKRITGKSFVTLKYPVRVLPQIVMVLVSVRPMRVFVPIGVFFILLGAAVFSLQLFEWVVGGSDRPVQNTNLVLGSVLFGVQTFFFGLLAELIVQMRRAKDD